VGVSWYNPLDRPPVIGSYDRYECGRYSGQVPANATVELACDQPRSGRYVTIQFPTVDPMNFCELDVCAYG